MAKTEDAAAKAEAQANSERIERLVLDKLGRPPRMTRATVTQIKGNTYRVNIYVEIKDELGGWRQQIGHSFFVTDRGAILDSDPPIVRLKHRGPDS